MATTFTSEEWRKINDQLDENEVRYGLPSRVYGSVVLGSFNIRKLGAANKRTPETWQFFGRMCRRFDLLAVQEVLDDLSGLERLREEMGPEYRLIVSDKTGAFPGDLGLNERLAFIYRSSLVRRGPIVSDITYDRTKVHELLVDNFDLIAAKVAAYREKMKQFEAGQRSKEPKFEMPVFLSFIRQPYTVSFRIVGHPEAAPYELMAVNAHLIFGNTLEERKREFAALMEWIIGREEQTKGEQFPGLVLLGDLNLDFNVPEKDIRDIAPFLKGFKNKAGEDVKVVFPFLRKHPDHPSVFRTNARQKETFDQIGFFFRPEKVSEAIRKGEVSGDARGPDYGVVNFVNLFAKALEGVEFELLDDDRRHEFYKKFEHSVSDHMPIWVRFPLPD